MISCPTCGLWAQRRPLCSHLGLWGLVQYAAVGGHLGWTGEEEFSLQSGTCPLSGWSSQAASLLFGGRYIEICGGGPFSLTFPCCYYHHHIIITIISFLHEAQWIMGAWVVLTVQWQHLYLLVLVSVASTQVRVSLTTLSGHITSCTL